MPRLQRTHGLLQRFLERASDCHRFPHAFHLRGQSGIGLREFFECESRHFDDAIVDGWLKAGRRFARDVVPYFVQQITDRQLGGDLRNREARGLGRQRRRPRHARIHFDNHHAPVVGVHRELDVRAARFHAHRADDCERSIAHDLEFFVRERLDGRHRNGIAGVHTHRIEIFNGANDHAVVRAIAHHFHLEFLPAEQ